MNVFFVLISVLLTFSSPVSAGDCSSCTASEEFAQIQEAKKNQDEEDILEERIAAATSLAESRKDFGEYDIEIDGKVIYVRSEAEVCKLKSPDLMDLTDIVKNMFSGYSLVCVSRLKETSE